MPRHRRKALIALVLGIAVALPARWTLAQGLDWLPDDRGAPDAGALDAPMTDEASDITPAEPRGERPYGVAGRLADWIVATDDNGDRPFLIVDKLGARIYAFDAGRAFAGSAPVLVGLARGDDSAPGIGKLKLSQISDDARTTPAGRFVATFGGSAGHGTVLWVDPADAISLHPVMSVNAGERRLQRIRSSDPGEHRISYGCINVPATFYNEVVLKALNGGSAIVYVLPDTKPIADVFPAFAAAMSEDRRADAAYSRMSRADQLAPYGVPDPTP